MIPVTRTPEGELATADLVVDAVYEGRRGGNAGDDPLPRLIGVSNQGGFRYLGSLAAPTLIVLTSSFNDPDWPDYVDRQTGIVTYFGDNKHPGRLLHETPRNGNVLLRNMFSAIHANPPLRSQVPPILIFGNTGAYRDMVFLGLAVPGNPALSAIEDLVAIWKASRGQRFQNYRATLTVLDVPAASRAWIEDIKRGDHLSSQCPDAWRNWVRRGVYTPLKAKTTVEHRSRAEQVPATPASLAIIQTIYEHFKDKPVAFEACAAAIVQTMDNNFISVDLTRPSRDGGRDAIGLYRIGYGPCEILVDFALEAKCYNLQNSVGVREVSRLISRLRYRQFGVFVTTSFVNAQAYKEIKEDKHPVVIVTASDIVTVLGKAGLNTKADVQSWLDSRFRWQT